ncbi:MAG TPA: DinB family protein [Cytophagaceae bacterium]|jgi:hypothetical protein|nr:DinB family protein [Cytophagaceae bacterium]
MKFIFETLNQTRANALKSIEGFSEEQLAKIPEGFGNNILWNLGHMVASQQILCYKLAGIPMITPDEFVALFQKGTSPKNWTDPVSLKEIKYYFEVTSEAFQKDYDKKIFENYRAYKTSSGVALNTIDDALVYNYGHENLHLGVVLTLRKLVS